MDVRVTYDRKAKELEFIWSPGPPAVSNGRLCLEVILWSEDLEDGHPTAFIGGAHMARLEAECVTEGPLTVSRELDTTTTWDRYIQLRFTCRDNYDVWNQCGRTETTLWWHSPRIKLHNTADAKPTGGQGGSTIQAGQTVTTQAKPKKLVLPAQSGKAKTTLVLDQRSQITYTEESTPGGKMFFREFQLSRGTVWYTTKVSTLPIVETETASVSSYCTGARSATFTVEVVRGGTRVRNYGQCEVDVDPPGEEGYKERLTIAKGRETTVRAGRAPTPARRFTPPKKPFWACATRRSC